MNTTVNQLLSSIIFAANIVMMSSVLAQEMDHSMMDHARMKHNMSNSNILELGKNKDLQILKKMPSSGKAREAGFDGRYMMEYVGTVTTLQAKCAQASRGLVMLNNDEWSRCGDKPVGSPKSNIVPGSKTMPTEDHTGHNR